MNSIATGAIFVTCLFLAAPGAIAAEPLLVNVWPGKVPGENKSIEPEKLVSRDPKSGKAVKRYYNVSVPTISIFRPAKEQDTGTAVVVCPGGGYNALMFDYEGEDVAKWLNTLGVTGIVLKYRVPRRPDQPKGAAPLGPLQDAQRTLSLLRRRAPEWDLDLKRIGILGFSAGGHLAAATATNFDKRAYEPIDDADKLSCRPDFAVMIYPGGIVPKDKDELAPEIRVRKGCPPCFFAHAGNDPVRAENSAVMYLALKKAGVPAELHIYGSGGHGFGLRRNQYTAGWPESCAAWLRVQGFLKKSGE